MARNIVDWVAVMSAARIVEVGSGADVLPRPRHSYPQVLISVPGARHDQPRTVLAGELTDAASIPAACTFHSLPQTRRPFALMTSRCFPRAGEAPGDGLPAGEQHDTAAADASLPVKEEARFKEEAR